MNICDRVVGLYLAIAIISALHHRAVTGEGQEIEVPMLETMAQFVLADHMGGGAFVPPLGNMGYKRLLSRVRGPYPTKDGYLALVVYTDKHWRAFSALVGEPGLLDTDPRFRDQETRTQHAEDMGALPAGASAAEDHRGMDRGVARGRHPGVSRQPDRGSVRRSASEGGEAVQRDRASDRGEAQGRALSGQILAKRRPSIRRLAPNLGEHTDEVLPGARRASAAARQRAHRSATDDA